ncbi:hypothetical protein BJ508DRAFT_306363 [Ascobolus immersus RN42]|uniref:MYND-type domain-containing protein n=1 Tax=Ascobolus immersus RN42 TaxID=1160509 RepID=A0A3N4IAQ7_ASCIM|nr:hypothetical protein BJ508DRAFT_306363 [Ascobolus immersus RN42]
MSNSQPTSPTSPSASGPADTSSPANPFVPTISEKTRPLLYTGFLLPSASSTAAPIPLKITSTISETLVLQAPSNLTVEHLFYHVQPMLLKFRAEHAPKFLEQAKKAGMDKCIVCGKDGLDVAIAFKPVLNAGRVLIRAGVVCCFERCQGEKAEDEALCRDKAVDYLQTCLNKDIESHKETLPLTSNFNYHFFIPGSAPPGIREPDSYSQIADFPLNIMDTLEPKLSGDIDPRKLPVRDDDVIRQMIREDNLSCGVCFQKKAVDFHRSYVTIAKRGVYFLVAMPICHMEGTRGACGPRAKVYCDGVCLEKMEEEKKRDYSSGFASFGTSHWCGGCRHVVDLEKYKGFLKKCSGCGDAWYCSKECQKVDWRIAHKNICKAKPKAKIASQASVNAPLRMLIVRQEGTDLVDLLIYLHRAILSRYYKTMHIWSVLPQDAIVYERKCLV